MKRQLLIMSSAIAGIALLFAALVTAYAAITGARNEGMVEYIGAQKSVFESGKATSVVSLEALAGQAGLYAIGPVEDLDGEITIFDSKPYVTKVRGKEYVLDTTYRHSAFFLVWTNQADWKDIPVPVSVKGYVDLQQFVKDQAQATGIDTSQPFPFLMTGAPKEIKWHINVDRTGGKPITKDLFMKSKQRFNLRNEPVDIIGFYAEHHAGIFLPKFTPAIKEGSGRENAIHIHLVSRLHSAAGHIDDITLGEGMTLRLPKR
jgi:acetolactate decarboxylase